MDKETKIYRMDFYDINDEFIVNSYIRTDSYESALGFANLTLEHFKNYYRGYSNLHHVKVEVDETIIPDEYEELEL